MLDPAFTAMWVIWLLVFVAIEFYAIGREKKGDTLSEHVWRWFSVRGQGKFWLLRRMALGAFLGWLLFHFMTGR